MGLFKNKEINKPLERGLSSLLQGAAQKQKMEANRATGTGDGMLPDTTAMV
jgi:hypothetical protein